MKNNKLEKVSSLKRLMLKISPNLFWKNIEEIGEFSFSEINIDSLIIPDNVKEIDISAFARNKYIKKITLSANFHTNVFGYVQILKKLIFQNH